MDSQKLTHAVALTGSLPCQPRLFMGGASQFFIYWDLLTVTDFIGDGDSNVCDPIRQGPL